MKTLKCGFRILITTVFALVFMLGTVQAAGSKEEKIQSATVQFYCAMGDMLAYNSQLNEVIRNVISDFGYETVSFTNQNTKAATNFVMFKSKEPDEFTGRKIYILSVPGTEKMKDVEVDLRFGKVLFGGETPAQFDEYAQQKQTYSNQPLVHRGFNDYTQTAFFTPGPDGALGADKIREFADDSDEHLIITGHSLGGAVAVLLGTRLQCMGIPPENLEVVTFGAPAVGNQAFADVYGAKLKYTRYTMSGDPVQGMLQMLKSGYVQTGEEIKCKRNANSHRFSHNMSEYLDYSIRNYLDVLQQEGIPYNVYVDTSGVKDGFSLSTKQVKDRVYLTPAVINLPDDLLNDADYMGCLTELLSTHGFKEIVKGGETDPTSQIKEAQKYGCDRMSHVNIDAKLIKKNVYQISVNEEITDVYGNILSTQTCGTTTDNISPLEAVFYGLSRCATSRQMFR